MELLNFKKRKTLALYMMLGLFHTIAIIYIYVPFSSILSVPYTWNRDMWTVITGIGAVIVSLFEKKQRKEHNYIWVLLTALLVTFITSVICATVMLIFAFPLYEEF